MTSKKTRLVAGVTAVLLTLSSLPARAGWMDDFYNSAGAAANVTPAQAISTQSVLGYSGGGLTWRVPNRTFQPVQITPPSIKAGCGGIDMFLGGFSFVNKDAFVQALRNFGQAAVGYFFMLALRSMAPEVAVTLEAINDIAQRINQYGMNSCQAAKIAVNSLAGKWFDDNKRDASDYARTVGTFVDNIDSVMGINAGGVNRTMAERYAQTYGKDRSLLLRSDIRGKPPVDVNLLFWLVEQSNQNVTDEEVSVMMSLLGPSVIIRSWHDGSTGDVTNDGKGQTLSFKDLIGSPDNATQDIRLWECANAECTSVTQNTQSVVSFSRMAYDLIEKLRASIIAKSDPIPGLTPLEQSVLKLSSLPLARYAAMTYSSGIVSGAANAMQYDIAQLVALDAVTNLVRFYGQILDKALGGNSKLDNVLQERADKMRDRLKALNEDVNRFTVETYALRGKPFEKMDELAKIERSMYSSLNANLAASARFSKRN